MSPYKHQKIRKLLFLFAGALALVVRTEAELLLYDGVATLKRFEQSGAEIDGWVGHIKLSCNLARFRLKVFQPGPDVERRINIVSDYKTIYHSEIVRASAVANAEGDPKPDSQSAFARFDAGLMPNGFVTGWGLPQAFVLSYHLARHSDVAVRNGQLENQYYPEHVKVRAKEQSFSLSTTVETDSSGRVLSVSFWGAKRDARDALGARRLLTKLEILAQDRGLPTRARCTNYRVTPDPASRAPFSIYEFEGVVSVSGETVERENVAYEDGVTAAVNDLRSGRRFGYVLAPTDEPPFQNTKTQKRISNEKELADGKLAQNANRRGFIIFLGIGSTFFLVTIALWSKRRQNNNKQGSS